MKQWIAFWNILWKDMRCYYLKPPNVSWGIIFPLAWTGMFFLRSGKGLESVPDLLPGVVAVSILFGTANAFVPILLALVFFGVPSFDCLLFVPTILLIAATMTFLGLFIAVAVSEVFEAQTFSNFFRFPMIFLCGLFLPVSSCR